MLRTLSLFGLAFAGLALFLSGCDRGEQPAPSAADKKPDATPPGDKGSDHGHKPGTRGGTIVEIGRDNYHAEAVFGKNGVVRLYTLGKDEARVEEVEAQTLTAYARPEGGTDAAEFLLKPAPRRDDTPGKTSRFLGTLPKELWGQRVEVTVPSIRIAGARYRFAFSTPADHADGMPPKLADEEERKLFLTPGGMYTEADIRANGNQTASEKFKGQMASHDSKPKKGDRLCPITLTKANPKFTWVVGGKTYEFCCPPCVDEFVKAAKENPGEIKTPESYVKQ
jgi:hypothetical protein